MCRLSDSASGPSCHPAWMSEGESSCRSSHMPRRSCKAGPTPGSSGRDSSSAITPKRVAAGESLCRVGGTWPCSRACTKGARRAGGRRSAMGKSTRPWSACCNKPAWVCSCPVCRVRARSMPPSRRSVSTEPGTLTIASPRLAKAPSQQSRTGPCGARRQMPPKPCGSSCSSCSVVSASVHRSKGVVSELDVAGLSFMRAGPLQAASTSCKLRCTRAPESVSSNGLRRRR